VGLYSVLSTARTYILLNTTGVRLDVATVLAYTRLETVTIWIRIALRFSGRLLPSLTTTKPDVWNPLKLITENSNMSTRKIIKGGRYAAAGG
jgi:hypothetical protein